MKLKSCLDGSTGSHAASQHEAGDVRGDAVRRLAPLLSRGATLKTELRPERSRMSSHLQNSIFQIRLQATTFEFSSINSLLTSIVFFSALLAERLSFAYGAPPSSSTSAPALNPPERAFYTMWPSRDHSLFYSFLLLPSLSSALTFDCTHLRVEGHRYDFSALGGPHSVIIPQDTPPSITNTTYTIDLCYPLEKKSNVPKLDQCHAGARGEYPLSFHAVYNANLAPFPQYAQSREFTTPPTIKLWSKR